MTEKYNFPIYQWEALKTEIRAILIQVAKQQELISYSDLVAKLSVHLEPNSYALAHMLGEVSIEEDHAGRPLLSGLVINQEECIPGQGFFKMAADQGRNTHDQLLFWTDEVQRIHQYWTNR